MNLPDDLPGIIYYRVGKTCRTTLPRTPVRSVGTSGITDAPIVCPQIPFGCDAWRLSTADAWKPLDEMPPHWWPFVDRPRPSEMDFREEVSADGPH